MPAYSISSDFRWAEVNNPISFHDSLLVYFGHCRTTHPLLRYATGDIALLLRAVNIRMHTNKPPLIFGRFSVESDLIKVGRSSVLFEEFIYLEKEEGKPRTLLATSTATVLLVNMRTKKPDPMPDGVKETAAPSKYALESFAKPKIPTTIPEDAFQHRFLVRQSDLDVNVHVTNARFIIFFDDALVAGFLAGRFKHEPKDISGFELTYEREVKLGEVAVICWFDEQGAYIFILKREDGIVAATGRMFAGEKNTEPWLARF
ncbi:hypothetical protein BC938DRAFT_481424 [Jimgerdemannia flammicorona]|uniref:Acyl-ACP thioesterase-like C-terminal domain-containing protein n=1 Tax=Jimgerdemannia flammicorona TaxID=994334 RepID=A0A433QX56_9FUNG|nr:hypothetical protein BC938DRAFT_481424 [Jimgerdemannia flammicorona]